MIQNIKDYKVIHCEIGLRKPHNSVIDIREESCSEIFHYSRNSNHPPYQKRMVPLQMHSDALVC